MTFEDPAGPGKIGRGAVEGALYGTCAAAVLGLVPALVAPAGISRKVRAAAYLGFVAVGAVVVGVDQALTARRVARFRDEESPDER